MIEFIPLLYLLLLFIFLTILLIAVMIGIFYKSKRWLYSQLLLPRILGAAVVGLVPLLLSNQAWLIGIQSNITSWLLLSLLTYIGSYVYMFIEVYKTMQFVQGQSLENALRVSTRIFCIASFETLSIVTIVTTLVFPAISKSLTGLNTDILPIHIDLPWLSFDLFPTLILLWSGFALFIGSFVQLLWQEKRITDTV